MKPLLITTQLVAMFLLTVSYSGCDVKRPKPTAKRPPPVVTVGEGDGYEQNPYNMRYIPVGAQLTITPAEETIKGGHGADGWRIRIGPPCKMMGAGL